MAALASRKSDTGAVSLLKKANQALRASDCFCRSSGKGMLFLVANVGMLLLYCLMMAEDGTWMAPELLGNGVPEERHAF